MWNRVMECSQNKLSKDLRSESDDQVDLVPYNSKTVSFNNVDTERSVAKPLPTTAEIFVKFL